MPSKAWVCLALLVAACASAPEDDPLVWSDELARALPLERGDTVEAARFSRAAPGPVVPPWEPFVVLRGNVPTDYRVVELNGVRVLAADGRQGGTGLFRKLRVDPRENPLLEWRWRVPRPAPGEPPLAVTSSKSPIARISLAFHGDTAKLDFEDRTKLRMARALTVQGLPYASLLYVWMHGVPVGTVVHSVHTERVRMIVVESGPARAGEWVTYRRNVLEDYRRAFGEEAGEIVSIGLMTDPGDDGSRRRGFYGDMTFHAAH
jgi:hypothetical protein